MIDEDYIEDELLEEGESTETEGQGLYEHFRIEVDRGQEPLRIDKYLTEHTQHSSRNRIQQAAEAGFLFVNDRPVKSNYKVRSGDVITLMLDRPHFDTTIEPEDIPLDVRYEDDELMVIYKPAGMVVHPGCGNFHGTLVHAIAWHLRNLPTYDPNDPQVGLVHRIDKDTSGLLVVAKTPEAKSHLGKQFFKHDNIGHPLFADERYGGDQILRGERTASYKAYIQNCFKLCPRQALHAKTLGFVHPKTGEQMDFTSTLPDDMSAVIEKWRNRLKNNEIKELIS